MKQVRKIYRPESYALAAPQFDYEADRDQLALQVSGQVDIELARSDDM